MSSALEAAGADAPKRQKRPGTGIVASLGREILLQARALDKASGVKLGVEDARSGSRIWITKVQQTASVSVYIVNVMYRDVHQLPPRTSVITATFKDLSNAIESFMTAANPGGLPRDLVINAFKVWEDQKFPVMTLTCGYPKLGSTAEFRAEMEKRQAKQIARLTKLLDDSVSLTVERPVATAPMS
jgi:hypothetical protein